MLSSVFQRIPSTNVHVVEETELSDTLFVGMINGDTESIQQEYETNERNDSDVNCVSKDKWIVSLQVNGVIVQFKLDTGVKANLISTSDLKEMKIKPRINRNPVSLKIYNGQEIKVCADSEYVSRTKLITCKACEELGLVKRVYCINVMM